VDGIESEENVIVLCHSQPRQEYIKSFLDDFRKHTFSSSMSTAIGYSSSLALGASDIVG
jgi:hypothetical protein